MSSSDEPRLAEAGGGPRIVADADDFVLYADLSFGSPVVFITFTHRLHAYPAEAGFGARFLAKNGIDHFCFLGRRGHWWHAPGLEAACAEHVAPRLGRYRRRVLYGGSMGASGALMHSRLFDADLVICASPIVTVRPDRAPFDRRWRDDLAGFRFTHDEFDGLSRTAEIVALYDPFQKEDAAHVALLRSVRPARGLRLPFAGHGSTVFLRNCGLLSGAILSLADGSLDEAAFRREVRRRKRGQPEYWIGLVGRLLHRPPGEALRRSAGELMRIVGDISDPRLRRSYARKAAPFAIEAYAALDDVDGVTRAADAARALRALDADGHRILFERLRRLGDQDRALQAGIVAAALAPRDGPLLDGVAACCRGVRNAAGDPWAFMARLRALRLMRPKLSDALSAVLARSGLPAERLAVARALAAEAASARS